MPSLPLLKALGLNFSPNQLEAQPGSLVEASNVIIRRDNVIESRRGYALYGTAMGSVSDRCKQLLTYKNKLIRHFSNRLQYENGLNNAGVTSFFDFNEIVNGNEWVASISEAQSGLRIKSIEANSNLYFTSSEGVRKISAKSSDTFSASNITQAGGVKALDAEATLNVSLGDVSSFLTSDSGVAYKIVWGTKDSNGNLVLGAPSDAVTVLNPLLDLTLRDFSNFLFQLDNVTNSGSSLLNDTNYYSSLALPISATSVELRNNLISLAKKLDEDLLFANDSGTGAAYSQLNISGATVSSGVVTVNFSAGTATNYFISGDKINIPVDSVSSILGFTSNGVSVDGINTDQILTGVAAGSVTFTAKNYTASNPVGVSGTITNISTVPAQGSGVCVITCGDHGLKNTQTITISGSNSVPSINGTYNISYLSKDTFSIDLKKSFSTSSPLSTDITSANHGYVAGDTVSFNVTTPTNESITFNAGNTVSLSPVVAHGLQNGNTVTFPTVGGGTTGVDQNKTYYVINVATNTFQLATTAGGTAITFTAGTGTMNRVITGTQYYVLSAGLATNTFRVSTVSNGSANTLTGSGTVAKLVTQAGSSASWNVVVDGTTTAKLEGNLFRSIEQPVEQNIPATNDQLLSLQEYLSNIISSLQEFVSARGSNIISSSVFTYYLETLGVTSNASVTLKTTIPEVVRQYSVDNNPYFYQVYRTAIATVTGVSSISDIAIIQEYYQIEEKFPTSLELSSGVASFIDNTPESIAGTGAYLYTNERSGEGGLQANDVPPFALDINRFKGYTFFSNTSTRQRKTLTLIGVVNMINNFNLSDPYKLTISDGTTTNTYQFVTGKIEVTELGCGLASNLVSSASTASYFTINSANDELLYYVWYKVGSSIDPKLTVPALSEKIGIAVSVNTIDSATVVANKTKNAISNVLNSFIANVFNLIVTASASALTNTFTSPSHGLSNGDIIQLASTGELPRELNNDSYYIVNAGLNTFQLSLTLGGTVVDFTTDGSATIGVYRLSTSGSSVLIKTLESGETTDSTFPSIPPLGFSITTAQNGRGENVSNRQVLLSSNASVGIAIEETAKSLIRVINKNDNDIVNAFYISGTNSTPGTFLIEGRTLNSNEFYIVGSDSIIGESFNPDISPSGVSISSITSIDASSSLVTTSANHNLFNGNKVIISNTDATPLVPPSVGTPITDGVHEITWLSATTFSIPVGISSPSTKGCFELTTAAESSSNEEQPHRIYYSKYQQPESVPIANYIDIGATDKAILRIFPLRDSLFVFKEDGLYRLSGETAPFTVALFDSSCILFASDSLSVANNQLYGWTTQGVCTITEAGVNVISRPIDTEILKKASSQFLNFSSATWGIGYESDNSYTVYTTNETDDTVGTIGFRYSNLTNSWTTVDKTATCGIVNPSDDKLYLGAGDVNYLEKERKEFTRYDYADRELSLSIVSGSFSNKTISLPTVSTLSVGDVVVQDQTLTVFEFNSLLEKLDLDPGVPSADYYSTLAAQAGDNLRSKLVSLATKLDSELTFGYSDVIGSLSESITTAAVSNPVVITTAVNHGLQTGRRVTISGSTAGDINGNFEVTVTGSTTFTIPVDLLVAGTGGAFSTIDENFYDIKVCYNLIVSRLNTDPIVSYSNYRPIDNNTIQESIIESINSSSKTITLNLALDYVIGPISVYKAIPCSFVYSPLTMGDPLGLKHLREATVMFANKAFTAAEMSFSTDLLPEFISVEFSGDGNGIFGHQSFGSGFFGGASNSAPFRTYVPRQCQRCRYINVGFAHQTAREQFAIYGITLTGEVGQSTRAYR